MMTPAQEYSWGQVVLKHEKGIDRDCSARGTPGFNSKVFPTTRSQHYILAMEIQLIPNGTEILMKPFIGRYTESSVRETFNKLRTYGALTQQGYKMMGNGRGNHTKVHTITDYNRTRMNKALCLREGATL